MKTSIAVVLFSCAVITAPAAHAETAHLPVSQNIMQSSFKETPKPNVPQTRSAPDTTTLPTTLSNNESDKGDTSSTTPTSSDTHNTSDSKFHNEKGRGHHHGNSLHHKHDDHKDKSQTNDHSGGVKAPSTTKPTVGKSSSPKPPVTSTQHKTVKKPATPLKHPNMSKGKVKPPVKAESNVMQHMLVFAGGNTGHLLYVAPKHRAAVTQNGKKTTESHIFTKNKPKKQDYPDIGGSPAKAGDLFRDEQFLTDAKPYFYNRGIFATAWRSAHENKYLLMTSAMVIFAGGVTLFGLKRSKGKS